jgi:hypothetical protein
MIHQNEIDESQRIAKSPFERDFWKNLIFRFKFHLHESMLQDANFIWLKKENKLEYEYFDLSITVINH